jgi:hypothetical protein
VTTWRIYSCDYTRKKFPTALAARATREFIFEHGRKGGLNTRDLYGVDYYSKIASKRKSRRGWPRGKLRKPQVFTVMALNTIGRLGLKPETKKMYEDLARKCIP